MQANNLLLCKYIYNILYNMYNKICVPSIVVHFCVKVWYKQCKTCAPYKSEMLLSQVKLEGNICNRD